MTPFEEGPSSPGASTPAVKVGLDSRYEVAFVPGVAEQV
jgi:hypothetical protein